MERQFLPGQKNMSNKENEPKSIGDRFIAIRKKLRLKQNQFAKQLEISAPVLSQYESGNTTPRLEFFIKIVKQYNVNLNYLILGEGEMFIEKMPDSNKGSNSLDLLLSDLELTPSEAEWFREFIYYFSNSKIARYGLISHILVYLLEKGDVIRKEINNKNKEKGEKNA